MQRIVITGATGFLGGAVAAALHEHGASVIATGRDISKGQALSRQGVTFHACDLATDAADVAQMIAHCDAVVHCAALSAPWGRRQEFMAANVTATRHVVEACLRGGEKRLVHISSPSVAFDFKEQSALREDAPWSAVPANDYIATKREAESLVMDAAARGLDAIVLRPKALFGPGDTTLLPRVVRVARRGSFPLLGDGDPMMDVTWIGDAVQAVQLALRAPSSHRGKVFSITSGDPQPRSAVLGTMLEACGLPVRFRRIGLGKALAVATLLELVSRGLTLGRWEPPLTPYSVGALGYGQTLDISAARDGLGYAPNSDVLSLLAQTGREWRQANAQTPRTNA
jgi:nucleoside-diphosphate-sugar epimerase